MSTQITPELIRKHGLTAEEYESIRKRLGRVPNLTELGLFSVMWSEHCSYKSSRLHLKKLPTSGPAILQGPGENAGVVDLGDGQAAVFKIESHNHPSFIEPYQGAATGVGGIIRDIFTMGARPIALLDSLHFGPLEAPRSQLVMEGVVAGIAGYGNCMGIPTVGGEIHFQAPYASNPLVNVFCLGLASSDRIFRASAAGAGNPVIYVGARTGRDGIHGATMASEEFGEEAGSKRPNVQVGDPFMEKLLLEACLEAMRSGAVVAIQDMGAAGLTCSTSEMASRGGVGVEIELAEVPQREENMSAYEILLSESQERMLLVAERGREEEVLEIFRKWDLEATVIGSVRKDSRLTVTQDGKNVASLSAPDLTDGAPAYDRATRRPAYLDAIRDWRELDFPEPGDYGRFLMRMLASEHLCDRRWVFRQYDHMVRTNTVFLPGGDAALLRLKGSRKGLAMTLDANSRCCWLDPRQGARLLVAESCRNLVASGARPLAATNCLNFGNPENPEVMWQFVETVEGIREACLAFETPITGGNVSFYNETRGKGIPPTPVLGMVGLIDDVRRARNIGFAEAGLLVYLLGETEAELGASVYLEVLGHGLCGPCPQLVLSRELLLHQTQLALIEKELIESAHDISEGGLLVALAESCFPGKLGVDLEIESELRADHFLFSESPSRLLVGVRPEKEQAFLQTCNAFPVRRLGVVREGEFRLRFNSKLLISSTIGEIEEAWSRCFEKVFQH